MLKSVASVKKTLSERAHLNAWHTPPPGCQRLPVLHTAALKTSTASQQTPSRDLKREAVLWKYRGNTSTLVMAAKNATRPNTHDRVKKAALRLLVGFWAHPQTLSNRLSCHSHNSAGSRHKKQADTQKGICSRLVWAAFLCLLIE